LIIEDDILDARRNNFTIVRFVLASSVIYTHSFWLIRGQAGADDLSPILGAPVSVYAVDGFFFLSGFLVYPSLLRLGRVRPFLLARLARLWPALAASVLGSVLVGALFTSASLPAYLTGGETLRFLLGNLSLTFASYNLTGVTCGSAPCVINGSLWTLPWEARCYVLLAILGAIGLARPAIFGRIILPLILAGALIWDVPAVQQLAARLAGPGAVYNLDMIDRLGFCFFLGAAAYLFRGRIKLSWLLLLGLFALNLAAHRIGFAVHIRALFIGYAVLCAGLLTARRRPISGTWPDYSYGMYIYAFPLMILINAAWPTNSYLQLALFNLLLTLPVAALSWHLLEKPVLDAFKRSHRRVDSAPLAQP
jgi:peptidoglycan/LPS O-acetylase OafA/YrhL